MRPAREESVYYVVVERLKIGRAGGVAGHGCHEFPIVVGFHNYGKYINMHLSFLTNSVGFHNGHYVHLSFLTNSCDKKDTVHWVPQNYSWV